VRLGAHGAGVPSRVLVHGPPAVASRMWRLGVGGEADAAQLDLAPAFAEYAPTSFWALPPAAAAASRVRSRASFLLMPLNELVDEHYTVYFCRHNASGPTARALPNFCL